MQESDDSEKAGYSCSHHESLVSKVCLFQDQENKAMHTTHTHLKQPHSVESSEDVPVLVRHGMFVIIITVTKLNLL